ncbi:MAG TPA: prolyl oligopeptidase family serine peptidase [Streptosporangiaceae bacterium]|nr:prolyl oligopeptidase family serine peptidase [Streptosporangiaceae bacterium]
MPDSFPRQQARTRRFTLGVPRSFRVSPDGSRVAFLRSKTGEDPVTCLWVLDVGTGREQLIADPAALGAGISGSAGPGAGAAAASPEEEPAEEKARRERVREQAGGIVAYATDADVALAAFAVRGRGYVADLTAATAVREVPLHTPVLDPRPDPSGKRVAYVSGGALRVMDLGGAADTVLADPGGVPGVTYGLAEFIAAEEMGRTRGYWWSPDGTAILAARVDERPVQRWHIADPANPAQPPAEIAYPAAGTPNADVSALIARVDGGAPVDLQWDRTEFCYLVTVTWDAGQPLLVVQDRSQRRMRLLAADPVTGRTSVLREDTDPRWTDVVPGVPAQTSDGAIVWTAIADGARRLLAAAPGGQATPLTPASLNVREVLDVDGTQVLFSASGADPTEVSVWLHGPDGLTEVAPGGGVHTARRSGGTTVLVSRSLDAPGPEVQVLRQGAGDPAPGRPAARIASLAEQPRLPAPRPDLFAAGQRQIRTALLLPSWHERGSARLPVLLDPYGGPHMQRVVAAQGAYLASQWFAEQGFAVLVADGRGTPGRGPDWERAVWHDLAGPVLEDQVEALAAAAQHCADLDTSRVGIRGWSFGGYLAALAVLRRPDIFHAAVAGAPVTELDLYDTHYTERYLGLPAEHPEVYERNSIIRDAPRLQRPLLLIHGLVDDNVVAAHTLRMSTALLAAGKPHSVLPLSGVTHMTPQETVAENLLLLQVDFLRRALGAETPLR